MLRRLWPLAVLTLAPALVACGGDDDSGSSEKQAGPRATVRFLAWEPSVLGDPEAPVTRAEADKLAERDGGVVLADADAPGRFWAVKNSAAPGQELVESAEQDLAEQTDEPIVVLTLTDDGRREFRDVTRDAAERGQQQARPGRPAEESFQHFALVVDDKVYSRPFVDYRTSPDGIDPSNGVQIQGGLTVEEANDLADRINGGG